MKTKLTAPQVIEKFAGKIKTREDVLQFFCALIYELELNFHPDDTFHNYVHLNEEGKATFLHEQAESLNGIMEECFRIADKAEFDIYEVAIEADKKRWNAMLKETDTPIGEAMGG
jgi:hypothetical protein